MEQLDDIRVGQQFLEVGGALLAGLDLHDLGVSVAARKLNNAQPVASDGQTQSLGVDRDGFAVSPVGGQVGAVKADGQSDTLSSGYIKGNCPGLSPLIRFLVTADFSRQV